MLSTHEEFIINFAGWRQRQKKLFGKIRGEAAGEPTPRVPPESGAGQGSKMSYNLKKQRVFQHLDGGSWLHRRIAVAAVGR